MSLQHIQLTGMPAYDACRVEVAHFVTTEDAAQEWMMQLHITQKGGKFQEQIDCLAQAVEQFIGDTPQAELIFTRVFLSDASNQETLVKERLAFLQGGAQSFIEQPPLDGTRVALWLYFKSKITCQACGPNTLSYEEDGYCHIWQGNARKQRGDSQTQCRELFEDYSHMLEKAGGTLYHNSIRTWLFVQNVDVNYHGVVVGRNEHFDQKGLVAGTHFISSTGIQGRSHDYHSLVQLDSYSLLGVEESQIQFLYAPQYLNPTHEYGVRFERGTAVHLPDRCHCYISGTASIDNKGQVVHLGDIKAQCLRMWENVEALLAEAQTQMDDIMHMIVYLRDMADYQLIADMFEEKLPAIPKQIVLAPVCRPEWLIEMECITVRANGR